MARNDVKKRQSVLLPFLFCIALVISVACFGYMLPKIEKSHYLTMAVIFAAATAGVSVFCMLLLLQIRRFYRRTGSLPAPRVTGNVDSAVIGNPVSPSKAEDLRKLKALSSQVEVLSAMREISLLASQDVDFERLVEHALLLVEQLVGTREITLFLRSQDDTKILKVRARRAGGHTMFGDEIDPLAVDSDHVTEVARYGNIKREETDEMLDLTVPVMVDREVLGAVKVKIRKEDIVAEDFQQAELNLRHMINHISLAIKTPTLYDRAVIDGLTGLYTKRHLNAEIAKLFAGCKRLSKSLAVIMFDIDFFKKINDAHGHLSGDIILREVASIVKQQIREYDSAYRYGGEEMCVLLPDIDAHGAVAVAERIRKSVESHPFRGDRNQKVTVTISGGASMFKKHMKTSDDLISEADSALYEAKQGGRNQIKYFHKTTAA